MPTSAAVDAWVQAYVHAWTTYDPTDIAALFTPDGESHEWPYETHWIGRDAIVAGWLDRRDWQAGGWRFEWSILTINGDTAAIEGIGTYAELGRFANLWTVTFDDADGTACRTLRMWNNELT
jgi:hypothetical protein